MPVTDERCENCRFYDTSTARCRRFPPTQHNSSWIGPAYVHPMVEKTDWCGEWKDKYHE